MKLLMTSLRVLFASTLLCLPAMAGVTVIDLGAEQNNCCGDVAHSIFPEKIDASDPATVELVIPNAASPNSDVNSFPLSDGATLSWTNAAAWNNDPDSDAGSSYFLHRAGDNTPTTFTITTANPGDKVTLDFVGGSGRDGKVNIDAGPDQFVPVYTVGDGWFNVATDAVGGLTGTLDLGMVPGDDPNMEGNLGAARITITPIPEPASFALFGLGAIATFAVRRRR